MAARPRAAQVSSNLATRQAGAPPPKRRFLRNPEGYKIAGWRRAGSVYVSWRALELGYQGREKEMKAIHDARDIPESVRRILRREVNYGCPFRDCGDPLLTYHHFDPPFEETKGLPATARHNPAGMVALCRKHHDKADAKGKYDTGLYSKEQLRGLKRDPFVQEVLESSLPELPESLLVAAGGSLGIGRSVCIKVFGQPLIRLRPRPTGAILDAAMADSDGSVIALLDENDILLYTKRAKDICFSSKSWKWTIDSVDGVRVSAHVRRVPLDKLPSMLAEDWLRDSLTEQKTEELRNVLPIRRRLSTGDSYDIARVAAELQVEQIKERYAGEDGVPIMYLHATIPIKDMRGNNGTLLVGPWNVDFSLQSDSKGFLINLFGVPTQIRRLSERTRVPLYRVNHMATVFEKQELASPLVVVAEDANDVVPDFWNGVYSSLGHRAASVRNLEAAQEHFERAWTLDSNTVVATTDLSDIFLARGEQEKAQDLVNIASHKWPNHPRTKQSAAAYDIVTSPQPSTELSAKCREALLEGAKENAFSILFDDIRQYYEKYSGVVLPEQYLSSGKHSMSFCPVFSSDDLVSGTELTLFEVPPTDVRYTFGRHVTVYRGGKVFVRAPR